MKESEVRKLAREKHEKAQETSGRIITTGPIPSDLLDWLDDFCSSGMKPSKHGVIAEAIRRMKEDIEESDEKK